jgi:hypothetical protein
VVPVAVQALQPGHHPIAGPAAHLLPPIAAIHEVAVHPQAADQAAIQGVLPTARVETDLVRQAVHTQVVVPRVVHQVVHQVVPRIAQEDLHPAAQAEGNSDSEVSYYYIGFFP